MNGNYRIVRLAVYVKVSVSRSINIHSLACARAIFVAARNDIAVLSRRQTRLKIGIKMTSVAYDGNKSYKKTKRIKMKS